MADACSALAGASPGPTDAQIPRRDGAEPSAAIQGKLSSLLLIEIAVPRPHSQATSFNLYRDAVEAIAGERGRPVGDLVLRVNLGADTVELILQLVGGPVRVRSTAGELRVIVERGLDKFGPDGFTGEAQERERIRRAALDGALVCGSGNLTGRRGQDNCVVDLPRTETVRVCAWPIDTLQDSVREYRQNRAGFESAIDRHVAVPDWRAKDPERGNHAAGQRP